MSNPLPSQLTIALAATRSTLGNTLVSVGTQELRTSSSPPDQVLTPLGSYQPQGAAASGSASNGDNPNLFRPTSVPSRVRTLEESDEDESYTNPPVELDGDELPAYTPRRTAVAPLLPRRKHLYASRSQKLKLEITAPGESHILLVEGEGSEGDGRTWVKGQLKLNLPSPEAITHVKIRLKSIVQTMVMRIHGSGRHPVTEEVLVWEDAVTLWTDTEPPPPENESSDPSKLQGTFTFPFNLHLPARVSIRSIGREGNMIERRMRLPPSFVLMTDSGRGGRADWASCRYFVKVTLGRKGMLKVNERVMIPLIFQPKPVEPGGSPLRIAAEAANMTIPGPAEDVTGWAGKKFKHPVKRGMFSSKKEAWYETSLLLPYPARFARFTRIPFAIKILSSDPEVTGKFPANSISITLVQRAFVMSQSLGGSHDLLVGHGVVEEDGPPEFYPTSPGDGAEAAVWGTRFRGNIEMSQAVGSSFRAPNLIVQFLVQINISVSGSGNNSLLSMPVEICPSHPLSRTNPIAATIDFPSQPIAVPSNGQPFTHPQMVAQSIADPDLGLPPSYFLAESSR